MAKLTARAWSWSDVRAAKPSDNRLTVRLDPATYDYLRMVAQAQGESIHQLAASLLKAVAEDDAAAHAGGGSR